MGGTTRVRLLGAVQVERDGTPVRGFRSRKALALLGYLTTQDQPVSRERLVDLLWEDKTESQGRNNLSWVLNKISSLLPDVLQADRHTVQFRPTVPYWLDTEAFEELEAKGDPASLSSAAELYWGEFLDGLYFEGGGEFQADDPICLSGPGSQHQHRGRRILPQTAEHVQPVQGGYHPVKNDQIRSLLLAQMWGGQAVARVQHSIAMLFQFLQSKLC